MSLYKLLKATGMMKGIAQVGLGAGIVYGGNKLSEEFNNMTGTRGGGFYTGLASVASTVGGYGMMAKGGANMIGGAMRKAAIGITRNQYAGRLKTANGLIGPHLPGDPNSPAFIQSRLDKFNKDPRRYISHTGLGRAASAVEKFPKKAFGKVASFGGWGAATISKDILPGVVAGGMAAGYVGYKTSDFFRTRSRTGVTAPLGGTQFYDPVSGRGPRDSGMDPFADNTMGLVQALHKTAH